jgi:hypothetical protein
MHAELVVRDKLNATVAAHERFQIVVDIAAVYVQANYLATTTTTTACGMFHLRLAILNVVANVGVCHRRWRCGIYRRHRLLLQLVIGHVHLIQVYDQVVLEIVLVLVVELFVSDQVALIAKY